MWQECLLSVSRKQELQLLLLLINARYYGKSFSKTFYPISFATSLIQEKQQIIIIIYQSTQVFAFKTLDLQNFKTLFTNMP